MTSPPSKSKNSRDELIEKMDYYFSKERETLQSSYRLKLKKESIDFFIKTKDGSSTLNSPDFDGKIETMHNSNGAITESFEKFVKPFKNSYFKNIDNDDRLKNKENSYFKNIKKEKLLESKEISNEKLKNLKYKEDIAILDICSGLGYNSAAIIEDFLKNVDKTCEKVPKLSVDMVEISAETLAAGILVPSPIKSHEIVKKAIESKLIDESYLALKLEKEDVPEDVAISIHCEDARETVRKFADNSYDGIFLDPYSPAMAPELCTVEFFKELKRVIKDDGIVATYTLAAGVRYAFIEAGFYIGEGPIFGRIAGGTIASLNSDNIIKNISANDEKTIALSDAGIPFRDENLDLESFEILNNRKNERKNARHSYKLSSAVQTPIFLGKEIKDKKLKRRILRNLNKVNISDLKSEEACFIISPQFKYIQDYSAKYKFSKKFENKSKYKFNNNLKNKNNFKNIIKFNLKNNTKSNLKGFLNHNYKSNSKDRIIEMEKRLKSINNYEFLKE
ncbi:MAG: MnmC family methyltransferase [Methanobrevibacter sp.]|nr:MnmC family methyltransferase [Methanobrevibacter sp.]MCL2157244.1 MnmC family methyltransferase [Methanobrevibacter sp.]MCL2157268.1 MnmC family methyltransferase [Methanobrevibacter sp.]